MNVAISRAKYGLFIVGCAMTLQVNESWGRLINFSKANDAFYELESATVSLREVLKSATRVIKRSLSIMVSEPASNADETCEDLPGNNKKIKSSFNS